MIGTKEPAIKEYKKIADSITASAENPETGGVIGALKGIVQFCEAVGTGPWVTAMKKAAEIAPKMKWVQQNGIEIDASPVVNQANQIKSVLEGEISRLENAKKEIEEKSGKEELEAGSGTENTEAPSTGAF